MKFYSKPTLTLFLLLYVAIQSAQAQDTLRITLQDAVRIALSDNPTIKVAGQEILLKKEARREAYAGLFPEASLVGSYSRAIKKQSLDAAQTRLKESLHLRLPPDHTLTMA